MPALQELGTVSDLRDWLVGRVGDDDDIVIDDLQEEFGEQFELEDEKKGIRVRYRKLSTSNLTH